MKRCLITLKGIVQGVGFRPFVYNLAKRLDLRGTVKNTSLGLVIDIEGDDLEGFIKELSDSAPPLAKIEELLVEELQPAGFSDLRILASEDTGSFTLLSPDISICNDCLRELLDAKDRRYQYPFINCTNCGPRYTITERVPYDRPNTTMAAFQMCHQCRQEYEDPTNRRFHAQPNACPQCGPSVSFHPINTGADPLSHAIALLRQGGIVAVKGLGGFHLCCSADDDYAVNLLRSRKRKSNKPFALMLPDIERIRQICEVHDNEADILSCNRRPIMLLKKRTNPAIKIAASVSPNNSYFGCMLPYTALHYLLFYYNSTEPLFKALVMTSGNLAEEPIVKDNDEALHRLSPYVDGFLFHNRDIFTAIDDSVMKIVPMQRGAGDISERTNQDHYTSTTFIRRARGYVPEAISIGEDGEDVLGVGADLKNTFAITKGRFVIMSQHIGDMENEETLHFFEHSLRNLSLVHGFNPIAIGYDLHPDYLSSRWAKSKAAERKIEAFPLQHHHCHIASVIAEHNLEGTVIGAAFDGAGYGLDSNIWGSEFLICEGAGFYRAAAFDYIPLPGGDRAAKECWRPAIGLLRANTTNRDYWSHIERLGFIERYGSKRIDQITHMIDRRLMSPLSSSAGRLFDAVAAITGCCDYNTFEGEAAMTFEGLLSGDFATDRDENYDYLIKEHQSTQESRYSVHFKDALSVIIEDVLSGVDVGIISLRFHNTIAKATIEMLMMLAERYSCQQVALSGGVWQNGYLAQKVTEALIARGLRVYCNNRVPANDGGISLGQAYIVRKLLIQKGKR